MEVTSYSLWRDGRDMGYVGGHMTGVMGTTEVV